MSWGAQNWPCSNLAKYPWPAVPLSHTSGLWDPSIGTFDRLGVARAHSQKSAKANAKCQKPAGDRWCRWPNVYVEEPQKNAIANARNGSDGRAV
jgi:hypothetical protein